MNKTILKPIIKRTTLRNNFLKYRCGTNNRAYNAQRNLCVSLVRKAKNYTLITPQSLKGCREWGVGGVNLILHFSFLENVFSGIRA